MSTAIANLSAARLRDLLHYDPGTGVFTWRLSRGRVKAGAIAGNPRGKGYIGFAVDGKDYLAHRLACLFMTDEWPEGEVDHKDGVRSNNIWTNLRDGSHHFNMQNQRCAQKGNKLGLLGVSARGKSFIAQITVQGKQRGLGYFTTPEAAYAVYLDAKRTHHEGNTL